MILDDLLRIFSVLFRAVGAFRKSGNHLLHFAMHFCLACWRCLSIVLIGALALCSSTLL